MKLVITPSYQDSATRTAEHIAAALTRKKNMLLGLATGATPLPVYERLVQYHMAGKTDFSAASVINLDEYQGLAGDNPHSYHHYMRENLLDAVGVPESRFIIPQGDAPPEAELARLNAFAAGHRTDLQLLGIGTNGHIGFNEPDDIFHDEYHLVGLTDETIASNEQYFPDKNAMPRRAFTMGIGSIMRAGEIILLAGGPKKREAVRAILEAGPVTPRIPATILKLHPRCTLYLESDLVEGMAPAAYIEVERVAGAG